MSFHVEDDADVQRHQQQLGNKHAEMPAMEAHLVEVDLTEGDEQRQEHHDRHQHVEHRS